MEKSRILHNSLFTLVGFLIFVTVILTLQNLLGKPKILGAGDIGYTHYNNYIIFKNAFFHLIQKKDLYQLYPQEHWDYYKYSPTFSLLIFPLVYLPDILGLFFWNLLNVMVLFFAIWKLPLISDKKRWLILGFIFIELITSIQNSQSNGLIAGLIIFAFISMEKKQIALASLFIVLTAFIKIFGLVAAILFIFYPGKAKAFFYTIGWTVLFTFLPLLVISLPQLSFLYHQWFYLLQQDHSFSFGLSVSGWLHSWFGIEAKTMSIVIGGIIFCLPFFKLKFFDDLKFRLIALSSVLIWIVIFNHKAESPTFIIAVNGVALWFFSQKLKIENLILLIFTFILTVLSPTDFFPKDVRENLVVPYVLKVIPCILIWVKMTFDLLFYNSEKEINTNEKLAL